MSKTEEAVQWAISIANNPAYGYDQGSRWGPDYDCSSLVITAWQKAGVPVKDRGATYTGNMLLAFLQAGFVKVTDGSLRRGDVLLNVKSHTAMHIGGGQLVEAAGNESGGITGGQPGDQTGNEIRIRSYYDFPWDYVLRYPEEEAVKTYTVQRGDTLWDIAQRYLGAGYRYTELMTANKLYAVDIYPGMEIKIPGAEDGLAEEIAEMIRASGRAEEILKKIKEILEG